MFLGNLVGAILILTIFIGLGVLLRNRRILV